MHVAPLAPAPLIWGLTWRAPLPPYQQAGIARLLAAPGVLLADGHITPAQNDHGNGFADHAFW